jgi:hypothetical protein
MYQLLLFEFAFPFILLVGWVVKIHIKEFGPGEGDDFNHPDTSGSAEHIAATFAKVMLSVRPSLAIEFL